LSSGWRGLSFLLVRAVCIYVRFFVFRMCAIIFYSVVCTMCYPGYWCAIYCVDFDLKDFIIGLFSSR
jgi:hypothetical protein